MVIFSVRSKAIFLICGLVLLLNSCGVEKGPLKYSVVERESSQEAVIASNPLLLQSALKELLIPRCQMCHPWFRSEVKLNQRINPGKPLASSLYLRIEDGTMPPYGASFTNEELLRVYEAIEALSERRAPSRDYEH